MFEDRMAALEGAEDAFATASGMAAVNGVLFSQLRAGDHIVSSKALFGSCLYIVETLLPRFGVEVSFVDGTDLAQWRAAVRPDTKLVFLETMSNPTLEVIDIAAVAEIAHTAGAMVIVELHVLFVVAAAGQRDRNLYVATQRRFIDLVLADLHEGRLDVLVDDAQVHRPRELEFRRLVLAILRSPDNRGVPGFADQFAVSRFRPADDLDRPGPRTDPFGSRDDQGGLLRVAADHRALTRKPIGQPLDADRDFAVELVAAMDEHRHGSRSPFADGQRFEPRLVLVALPLGWLVGIGQQAKVRLGGANGQPIDAGRIPAAVAEQVAHGEAVGAVLRHG
jgi:hypothetical protein